MPKIKTMRACVKCAWRTVLPTSKGADTYFITFCIAKECLYRGKEDELPLTKEESDALLEDVTGQKVD